MNMKAGAGLLSCMKIIKDSIQTGYVPTFYNNLDYLHLSEKDKQFIDRLYESTFHMPIFIEEAIYTDAEWETVWLG